MNATLFGKGVFADDIRLKIGNEIILDYPSGPSVQWLVSLENAGEETQTHQGEGEVKTGGGESDAATSQGAP